MQAVEGGGVACGVCGKEIKEGQLRLQWSESDVAGAYTRWDLWQSRKGVEPGATTAKGAEPGHPMVSVVLPVNHAKAFRGLREELSLGVEAGVGYCSPECVVEEVKAEVGRAGSGGNRKVTEVPEEVPGREEDEDRGMEGVRGRGGK